MRVLLNNKQSMIFEIIFVNWIPRWLGGNIVWRIYSRSPLNYMRQFYAKPSKGYFRFVVLGER